MDKENMNGIIRKRQAFSSAYFEFHLCSFIYFDQQLFGKKKHEYLELYNLIHEENLTSESSVITRSYSWSITNCFGILQELIENQVETRKLGCVPIIFDSCGGVSGAGTPSFNNPFYYGPNLPNNYTNSNPLGGGSGGGSSSASSFQTLLDKCTAADTGEPGGNSTTLTDSEMDLCEEVNIISQYTGWGVGHENIAFLFSSPYWSMIAGYLQAGNTGEYSVNMIKAFMQMSHDGTTSLTWKKFMALYNLVVNELKPVLGLDEGEVSFLLKNGSLANQVKEFIDENGSGQEANEYSNYIIDVLALHLEATFEGLMEAWNWQHAVGNSNNVFEEDEIFNDIKVLEFTAWTNRPTGTPIGENISRANDQDPDLDSGVGGDMEGVLPQMLSKSDEELFDEMTDLFHWFSTGQLQGAGDEFINYFRTHTNTSPPDYANFTLNTHISTYKKMRNFAKKFGEQFNQALINNGGNITGINVDLQTLRPVFNSTYHSIHGARIMVNDTEHTIIEVLDDFIINSATGEWQGTFFFEVNDNFGLDRADVLNNQGINDGFAAWFVLQHNRGYVPMRTKIWISYKLKGKI